MGAAGAAADAAVWLLESDQQPQYARERQSTGVRVTFRGERPAANVESWTGRGSRGDLGTYSAMLHLDILKVEPNIFALENLERLIRRKT